MHSERVLLAIPISDDPYMKGGGGVYYPPQIGLAYIAAYLIKKGIQVVIFDGLLDPSYEKFDRILNEFSPTYLGVSAHTFDVKKAAMLASFAKKRNSDLLVVAGGPHPTVLPEWTLKEFFEFDYLVMGEGEEPLYQIIASKKNPKALANVSGVAFRGASKIVVNAPNQYMELDTLPFPAWDLFDLRRYKFLYNSEPERMFGFLTSRGCSFNCKFCSHYLGKKIRKRSIPNVISEMKHLISAYDANQIAFHDDTFTADKQRVFDLCKAMITEEINKHIAWGCLTRIGCLDRDVLHAMRSAGCKSISVGLESGSQKTLDLIKKEYDLVKAKETIKEIKKAGISFQCNFIIGFPHETRKDIFETINWAKTLDCGYAVFHIFVPYPGTDLQKEMDPDYKFLSKDWDDYRLDSNIFKHKYLSQKELIKLHRLAYVKFYFRRSHILSFFKMVSFKVVLEKILGRLKYFSSS